MRAAQKRQQRIPGTGSRRVKQRRSDAQKTLRSRFQGLCKVGKICFSRKAKKDDQKKNRTELTTLVPQQARPVQWSVVTALYSSKYYSVYYYTEPLLCTVTLYSSKYSVKVSNASLCQHPRRPPPQPPTPHQPTLSTFRLKSHHITPTHHVPSTPLSS